MTESRHAPLFTAAWDLSAWILKRWGSEPAVLPESLCREGLVLLDAVVYALKGIDRRDNLDAADLCLIRLRMRIRMAEETGLADGRQARFLLEQTDAIGRQLGGWMKTLDL